MKHKKLKLMCIVLTIITLLGGCKMDANEKNNTSSKKTQWEIREEMLNYIENKYNMEFEVADIEFRSWAYNYETMSLYPKGGNPDDTFNLYRYTKEDGEVYYKDYYIRYSMRDDYQKYVSKFVEKYFDKFKCDVSYSLFGKDDELSLKTTFEEFKAHADKNIVVYIYIYIPASSKRKVQDKFDKLSRELSNDIGCADLDLFGFTESVYEIESKNDFNIDKSLFTLEYEWGKLDFQK